MRGIAGMTFCQYPHEHIADYIESGAIVKTAEYPGVTIHTLADGRAILDIHAESYILMERAKRPSLCLVS